MYVLHENTISVFSNPLN